MTRTLGLVATGALAGALLFTGVLMLLGPDQPGDTPSPQLAVLLIASSAALAFAGLAVAAAWAWARWLSLAVGLVAAGVGIGGLILLLGSSLLVAGAFPGVILEPLNLTIALLLGLAGLTGVWLLKARASTDPSPAPTWPALAAGVAIGMGAAWIWNAVIYPAIPYECCRL